jgi:hypothetical protein
VRKKVLGVLASWSRQFKDDRSAAGIAGLYRQVKPTQPSRKPQVNVETLAVEPEWENEQKRRDKEAAKRKGKEKRSKAEETRRKKAASQTASSRKEFDFGRVRFPPRVGFCSRTTLLNCTSRTGKAAGPHCDCKRVVCRK